jgi:glyoxylase-like metal-dependent hydrolase (beta-lactamase superfamily II)
MPLETYFHISSEKGLSSVTSLIIGSKEAILFDPPFLIPDANDTVTWIKQKLEAGNQTLKAIFVTHHHPDHFFSANPILEAFLEARFFAAPYVLAGINKEYDDKVVYWPSIFGRENIPEKPRKPDPFEYTFFVLDGNPESPVHLLGPVQGDSVDHTIFWLPKERTLICGDSVYARSTHVWYVPFTHFAALRTSMLIIFAQGRRSRIPRPPRSMAENNTTHRTPQPSQANPRPH